MIKSHLSLTLKNILLVFLMYLIIVATCGFVPPKEEACHLINIPKTTNITDDLSVIKISDTNKFSIRDKTNKLIIEPRKASNNTRLGMLTVPVASQYKSDFISKGASIRRAFSLAVNSIDSAHPDKFELPANCYFENVTFGPTTLQTANGETKMTEANTTLQKDLADYNFVNYATYYAVKNRSSSFDTGYIVDVCSATLKSKSFV